MSASSPQQSAAPVEAQPTNEPVAAEQLEKIKPDVYTYTVLFITFVVAAIVMITTITGQWVKQQHTAYNDNQYDYSLWGHCNCLSADVALKCSTIKNLFRSSAGFSVIAVGAEFLAVILLFGAWTRVTGRGPRSKWAAVALAWLAAIALILSWTIFVGLYNKKYCGEKVKDLGNLSWAFGLRVGESIIWLIIAALFTWWATQREPSSLLVKITLSLAVTIFIISVATTTGRGWVIKDNSAIMNTQISVWQICNCTKVKAFPCNEERRLFRAEEAFAILSVFFTAILFYFVAFKLPRFLHVILAFASFSCIAITWITFSSWFGNTHCHNPAPHTAWKLYWPYGLNVIAFIVMVVNFVIALVGHYGLF